jgi:hypothetical protein
LPVKIVNIFKEGYNMFVGYSMMDRCHCVRCKARMSFISTLFLVPMDEVMRAVTAGSEEINIENTVA